MKKILLLIILLANDAFSQELASKYVSEDLSKQDLNASYWDSATLATVSLMAQPMVQPMPSSTTTDKVEVRSVHNGEWISFYLIWKDTEADFAGKLAQFSDAAALQFPIQEKEAPPPVFMGAKGDPVHIFHWRAQYQKDSEKGIPKVKDLYPNLNIDVYPMEYPDWGSYKEATDAQREEYSPGKVTGNPQAYQKTGVDEIYAEGFSTSSVQEGHGSLAKGENKDGSWHLIITRKLNAVGGSVLTAGKNSFIAFAIWQGSKGEVGSRKSLTMSWTNLKLEPKGN